MRFEEAFLDEIQKLAQDSIKFGPRANQLGPTKELLESTEPAYRKALLSAGLGTAGGAALAGAAKVKDPSRLARASKRISRMRKGGLAGALAGLGIYGAEDIAEHAPGIVKKIAPYSKDIGGAGAGALASRLVLGKGGKRQLLGALLGLGLVRAKDIASASNKVSDAAKSVSTFADKF